MEQKNAWTQRKEVSGESTVCKTYPDQQKTSTQYWRKQENESKYVGPTRNDF